MANFHEKWANWSTNHTLLLFLAAEDGQQEIGDSEGDEVEEVEEEEEDVEEHEEDEEEEEGEEESSPSSHNVLINTCTVCGDAYQGSMTCNDCKQYCHYRNECSVVVRNLVTNDYFLRCLPCDRTVSITRERALASMEQEKQAKSMLSLTAKKFKLGKPGDNVMVPIPDVDRGRAEFPNIAGVVMNVDADGSHTIGTAQGTLQGTYTRAEIIPSIASFLLPSDVPEKTVSLRTAARAESMGDGQGYKRCYCTQGCKPTKCGCMKANLKCNSKCKSCGSCKNK